jgi:hypothetical protein
MTDLHVEGTAHEAMTTFIGVCQGPSESASLISSAELAGLSATELTELRRAVAAGSRADRRIVAELCLRAYTQAAIDAKAAVIINEERRLARGAR